MPSSRSYDSATSPGCAVAVFQGDRILTSARTAWRTSTTTCRSRPTRSSTSRRSPSSSPRRRSCCSPQDGKLLARRRHPQARAGAAGLRQRDHDPAAREPHERHPRSVGPARPGRLALLARSDYRRRRAGAAGAAEGPELHARRAPPVFEQRLHAAGGDRQPRQRQVVPRVHDRADLQAARHDQHALPRQLQRDRQEPGVRLCARTEQLSVSA